MNYTKTAAPCGMAMLLLLGALFPLTAGAANARPLTVDNLVRQVEVGDQAARVEARRLLPRHGAEAVEKLIPLLLHDNAEVWWMADKIIREIGDLAGRPGHEAEREAIADLLMGLLTGDAPDRQIERALRRLPRVVPEGYSVAPMARLLGVPQWREKARTALQETGTAEAVDALCARVERSDPAFQIALLRSLAILEAQDCLQSAAALLESEYDAVRVAALHALAWTASPRVIGPAWKVRASASEKTEQDAVDGILKLADAMAESGGKLALAMEIYQSVLERETNPVYRGAAIAGLCRFGDETAVPVIAEALATANSNALEAPALSGFRMLAGRAANQALLEAYPQMPETMKPYMVELFGEKGDPIFMDILVAAAKSADKAMQSGGLRALAASRVPEAVPPLVAAVESEDAGVRALAIDLLRDTAEGYALTGNPQAAGRAYLAIYRAAGDEALRKEALDGLLRYPVAEGFDVVMANVTEAQLAAMPTPVQAGVAKALFEADRESDAQAMVDRILASVDTAPQAGAAYANLHEAMGGREFAQRLGLVHRWKLAGPFPWNRETGFEPTHIGEPKVDPSAPYTLDGEQHAWKDFVADSPEGTNVLIFTIGAHDNASALAYSAFQFDEETSALLLAGSDDGLRIWLNGEEVHRNNVDRGQVFDQDRVPVTFQAGKNELLVQVSQNGGGWSYALRLATPEGKVLPFQYAEDF